MDWPQAPLGGHAIGGVRGAAGLARDQRAAAWAGVVFVRMGDSRRGFDGGSTARPGEQGLPAGCADCAEGGVIEGTASHYGESYNGQPLGCGGGDYHSRDPRIIAVAPARHVQWPCGTTLRVCGSAGCVDGIRVDACPGCGANQVDLSEAGIAEVCGAGTGRCSVTIEEMTP